MGKKQKKNIADKVRGRQKKGDAKVNPFEVKINKVKHNVLGRKISKHDRGMPGLSRSKAAQKRENTLIQEYNQRTKSNKFVDKRFGEHDTKLSVEEKMVKRFAIERMHGEKQNKFSLNDDEDLTHYGQSLADIEKFENPDISDEGEDEDEGRISGQMVSKEHFGGFLSDANYEPIGGSQKSWKERMEEIITKSKKEKHERQMENEKSQRLTEELDSQFVDIRKLMSATFKKPKGEDGESEAPKVDDYDIAVRSLMFESKGQATDRLKTEEELAKEEKERLDKLEEDRKKRMRGESVEEKTEKRVHFSADDLNDGYAVDESLQSRYHVSYKDGKLLLPKDADKESDDDSDNEEEDVSCNNGEDEKDDESADEDEDSGDEDDDEDEDDGNDSDDSYKDIESDEEDDNVSETGIEPSGKEDNLTQKTKPKINLKEKKEIMEAARKELPYTFNIPENYEQLLELLQDHAESDQLIIIERVRKCYHPSLAEGNKTKLEVFFGTLVQYFCDLALQSPPSVQLMDKLTPILYTMTQGSAVPAGQVILDQIKDRQEEFKEICKRKAGRGLYPALDTLLLLKLVSVLFPTSDFRHPVTTPALLFITQMLAQCPVNHERDVAAGLFLCNLCLEFVSMSKRYIPECINFLQGLLFLAAEKDPSKCESVIHPFKPVGENIDMLKIKKKQSLDHVPPFKMTEVLSVDMEIDALRNDKFRLMAVNSCVTLLIELSTLYKDLVSYKEIFTPVKCMCGKINSGKYPNVLKEKLSKLTEIIDSNSQQTRKHLVMMKKKPVPLKMFEPEFAEVFDERKGKRKTANKELNEKQKLQHKYKKEMKGAMREIRKDSQALARKQLKDQLEKDEDRKRKVNRIYQNLASQEGEWKAMKRGKKLND